MSSNLIAYIFENFVEATSCGHSKERLFELLIVNHPSEISKALE